MSRYTDIDALLTSLGEGATVEQVEYALRDHITREVLAVLADRAAAGGGGAAPSGLSMVEVPLAFDDAYWATGDIKLITTLADGDILIDLWLTVATRFETAATAQAEASVFAGTDISLTGVDLFGAPWSFARDEIPELPVLLVADAPPPDSAAKSLAAQGAIDGSSKLVPLRATGALQIGFVPENTYELTQGAGWVNALIYTP